MTGTLSSPAQFALNPSTLYLLNSHGLAKDHDALRWTHKQLALQVREMQELSSMLELRSAEGQATCSWGSSCTAQAQQERCRRGTQTRGDGRGWRGEDGVRIMILPTAFNVTLPKL